MVNMESLIMGLSEKERASNNVDKSGQGEGHRGGLERGILLH